METVVVAMLVATITSFGWGFVGVYLQKRHPTTDITTRVENIEKFLVEKVK